MKNNPRSLSDSELKIYAEEIDYLFTKGYNLRQIADKLEWPEADVHDVLRTDVGRSVLGSEAQQALKLEEAELTLAEARAFAKKRLPHYIKQLDTLSQTAQSEQVRLNALLNLMKVTGALDDETKQEVVEMPQYLIDNLLRAREEVDGQVSESES